RYADLGAGAAGPTAGPGRARFAGTDERANLQPALPRGDRVVRARLAQPAARAARPASARDDRPPGRPRCRGGRPRHCRVAAPAPAGDHRGVAAGVPANVLAAMTALRAGFGDLTVGQVAGTGVPFGHTQGELAPIDRP